MSELKLKVPFKAPLNKVDTENQTWGCRANNPRYLQKQRIRRYLRFCKFRMHLQTTI